MVIILLGLGKCMIIRYLDLSGISFLVGQFLLEKVIDAAGEKLCKQAIKWAGEEDRCVTRQRVSLRATASERSLITIFTIITVISCQRRRRFDAQTSIAFLRPGPAQCSSS